jgi:hypothetical protein
MKRFLLFLLAAPVGLFAPAARAQFASTVVSYTPGSGVGAGYDDPNHALGSPTTFIGYQNTDPFNPAYQGAHLVSVGAGGSLTVGFSAPILNSPANAFGLDFNIFGNAGFVITNGDYSGGGITDGSLFANNPGLTRISVSADGLNYFTLNPALARTADGLFPTDANGNFNLPVNPALGQGDFAGLDLAGIRALYAGSGGGTGYDISWAQDQNGQNVFLSSISFIRVEVLSGKSELDAFSVVPEPQAGVFILAGVALMGFWVRRRAREAA